MIKTHVDLHLARKATHFFGVLFLFAFHYLCGDRASWIGLVCVGLPMIIFDFVRQNNETLKKQTAQLFGVIMRRREINGIAGTTFLLVGVALILALFPTPIVSLSLLFLAFADPIASFVGLKYGRIKIFGKKTLEGSLGAFVSCLIVSFFYLMYFGIMSDHLITVSLMCGAIAAVAEAFPVFSLDDNFTQPIISACLLYPVFYFFGGF